MITRDMENATSAPYDLIVIGGGIQGACMALESARRGLRTLLLERDDFGQATTWNSLRIIHGGLRYLQSCDISRFFESVAERSWFLSKFPDLVRPLSCLLPLYESGLRRKFVLRCALAINDLLSRDRNADLIPDQYLHGSRILSRNETISRIQNLRLQRLSGAAEWYDGLICNPPRLLMEIINWACANGAVALNYCEATSIVVEKGCVRTLVAFDHVSDRTIAFRSSVVVNCAGPWVQKLAQSLDRAAGRLIHPSMGFNLLLDRPSVSNSAVGVAALRPNARTYFLIPWKKRILAGTFHAPWSEVVSNGCPLPTRQQIGSMLEDLNDAAPGLALGIKDVAHCYAGILPALKEGSAEPATAARITDHSRHHGPRGLYSVRAVKWTTARSVAEKTIRTISRDWHRIPMMGCERDRASLPNAWENWNKAANPEELIPVAQNLYDLMRAESANTLSDLFLRRVGVLDWHQLNYRLAEAVCDQLEWPDEKRRKELHELSTYLGESVRCAEPTNISTAQADVTPL